MGLFRKPRESPKGDFSSEKYKRPLELGTRPNRITSFIGKIFGKTIVPVRNFALKPFSPYLAFREYRRKVGENKLLRKAYERNPELIKKYAPGIERINPALNRPETRPFGEDTITAIEALAARHERIATEKSRKMDAENAFEHQGVTNRITATEVKLLKTIEADRQHVLAESESMIREITLAALSSNSKKPIKKLDEIKKKYAQLISNTKFVQQELQANKGLYARLEQEYNAMHQRMYSAKADEAAFTSTGKLEDI